MEKRKIDIIKSLDEKYRKDFLDLEKCKKFKEEQEQQLKALQTEVCLIQRQFKTTHIRFI